MEKKKYNLKILNQNVPILSDEGDEYVDSLYRYVLSVVGKYDDNSSPFPMSATLKALYACIHLADELFRKQEELLKTEKTFGRELQKELTKKDKEIEKLRKDLDEFINEFDNEVTAKEFEGDLNEDN